MDDIQYWGRTRGLVAVALIGGAFGLLPATAAAESNVMMTPASGPPGATVSLLGREFGKRDRVTVRLGGTIVARARSSRRGSFTASFTVPARRRSRLRIVTLSRGRRVANVFRLGTAVADAEVASRPGKRMRWTPTEAPVGGTIHLAGSGLPPNRMLRVRFGGIQTAAVQTSRGGRFALSFTVPAIAPGRHLIRVKSRRKALAFFHTTTAGPSAVIGAPPPATPVSPGGDAVIYAAGDIACAPGSAQTSTKCREMKTSDIIVRGGASRVLALGDLQYNSASLSNLRNSYDRSWGRLKPITSPAIGNHEGNANGYFDYFNGTGVSNGPAGSRGKGYYSFDLGSWHLTALNSNCARVACNAGSAQESWLRADLAAHPGACTLAYWHHPRFSSGHDGDGTFMQDIWRTLYNAGVDVVLVGHSHNYERFAPMNANGGLDRARGIREFVVGTGGAFFTGISSARPNSEARQNNTYGVLKLTLLFGSYDWRFVPEAGKTFSDSGSQACH
jgi:acid phosphatase type 7